MGACLLGLPVRLQLWNAGIALALRRNDLTSRSLLDLYHLHVTLNFYTASTENFFMKLKGYWAISGVGLALLLTLTACSSKNEDSCKLYESAVASLDEAVQLQQDGVIEQSDVRDAFRQLPVDIGTAVSHAHGDVLVVMNQSFEYVSAYQQSQTKENGMAYFLQQSDVVDSCKKDGTAINID